MGDRQSAYAVLGLEPGADRPAVEAAYRRLIKLHHPDRSGGDAIRAAEINRAYFELRRLEERPPPAAPARRFSPARTNRRKRRRSSLWPALVLAGAALLLVQREWLARQVPLWIDALGDWQAPVPGGRGSAVEADSASLDGPLGEAVIARAIRQAAGLATRGDEEGLVEHSRACHLRLRSRPELAQLDRCAAFDYAAAAIADRDPVNDRGAFSASAVTARQMTAASLLSSDYLAIGRRLDRIRTMVELTLMPPQPLAPPPAAVDEESPAPMPDEVDPLT